MINLEVKKLIAEDFLKKKIYLSINLPENCVVEFYDNSLKIANEKNRWKPTLYLLYMERQKQKWKALTTSKDHK